VLPNRATAVELSPASHIVTIPSFLSPPPPLTSNHYAWPPPPPSSAQPLPTFGPSWGGLVDTATPLRRRHVTVERTPPNAAASPKRHPSTTPHHGSQRRRRSRPMAPRHHPQRRRRSRPMAPRHCPPTTLTKPPNGATSPAPTTPTKPPTTPHHDTDPNSTRRRVLGRKGVEEGMGKGGGGVQDNEAVCIPHAASFPVFFFVDGGGVHLALPPVFFVGSFPARSPSYEINEAVCIPHAASFSFFFSVNEAVCTLHAALFLFVLSPLPPPARITTRRRASHTPPRFLFFFVRRCCLRRRPQGPA
jgi:hypothetical protein